MAMMQTTIVSEEKYQEPFEMFSVDEEDMDIVYEDKTNLNDQLRDILRRLRWTTQDEATLSILPEMSNVHTAYLIRKSDGLLLGASQGVDTNDHVLANVYVTREGFRSGGVGMKLTWASMEYIGEQLMEKPMLGRAAAAMVEKYKRPPVLADPLYSMYSVEFPNRTEFLNFFPAPGRHNYQVQRVKDMSASSWKQLEEYDFHVTGLDRRDFLKRYYSVQLVEGIVLKQNGNIVAMVSTVPTMESNLYKVNPIYAENYEMAGILCAEVAKYACSDAKFITHVREKSAGESIINKCKDLGLKMKFVGTTYRGQMFDQPYEDKAKTHLMIAPTNSPAHFDG